MTRFTDKTVRTSGQCIKISRDNKDRIFSFARGYAGNAQAHEIETLPFKWVANWTEALDRANRTLAIYA